MWAMFWYLGALLPENKILLSKLLLAYHIVNLSENSIARKVYLEERRLQLGGLSDEVRTGLAQLNIRESLMSCTTKRQLNSLVHSKIREKNRIDILVRMKRYKKVDYFELKEEDF